MTTQSVPTAPSVLPRSSRPTAALLAGLGLLLGACGQSPVATSDAVLAAAKITAQDLGPNVRVFDPSMSTAEIRAVANQIAAQQVSNQFGPERYALLFKPGTYGSVDDPLNVEVGYGTEVAGLGASPDDVTIVGSVSVHNQCDAGSCIALNNFWRSLSNMKINVANANGCYTGEFWAVSQAAPMRRMHIVGNGQNITLMDYCTGPSYASGGFIADSAFEGTVINGSQQQFYTRNSTIGGWSNGVWNQVFSGVVGAPAQVFPGTSTSGPYTTLPTTPVSREKPFLTVDSKGAYQVFVPAPQTNSSGTTWQAGPAAGRFLPLKDFYVAHPGDSAQTINSQLARGQNVLFTPGAYNLKRSIDIKRANTVVLGLGLPLLTPQQGDAAITVADVPGVDVAGLMIDAGPVNSDVLMQVGTRHGRDGRGDDGREWGNDHHGSAANPTAVQDVFFRIGGAQAGRATVSLEVNSDHVILDDLWAWRADHGNGVGWTMNTADHGVIVNGDNVTATGLFVEHYQKDEVIWNGNGGQVIFFQNEMPYDPPSQAAWMSAPTVKGYPALRVTKGVRAFNGAGMGSYSFFNQGIDIYADNAFVVPTTLPAGSLRDLLTIFLDPGNGKGGILNVVNGVGGSSTIANPDVPVTVVAYP
nr:glycosyl hydrolase family 28-related protein [Deinococcus sp. KSM4-11]